MVFKAATAKVAVPAAGARVAKLLRGVEPGNRLGLGARFSRGLVEKLLETSGFEANYFHGDFLSGAQGALEHVASEATALGTGRSTFKSPLVEVALRRLFVDAASVLKDSDLEIAWDIEAITSAELDDIRLLYGMRRSKGLQNGQDAAADNSPFRSSYAGHAVVMRGERRSATSRDCFAAISSGATVFVDAHLTCRQTVMLRRRGAGEVLAGHFDEAAVHKLRLEAELEGVPSEVSGHSLRFDEDQGWLVVDLNDGLGGNCPASHLEEVE